MTNNKQQVLSLIQNNKQAFLAFGAMRVGLFGSFMRGEQADASDVDLLVEFLPGQKNYRNLLGTAGLAEKLMGREVDVLTPESISPNLIPYIEKEIEYVQIS